MVPLPSPGIAPIPLDAARSFPQEAVEWLLACNITPEDMGSGDILYSPLWRRIIFPLYSSDTNYLGWTGRSISSNHIPKWHHEKRFAEGFVYVVKSRNPEAPDDLLVLVEDVVSAIRVARQYHVACLFGLHLSDAQLQTIARQYLHVICWFDDFATSNALALSGRLHAYGVEAHVIWTQLDPKAYNDLEVRQHVGGSIGLCNLETVQGACRPEKCDVTPNSFPFPTSSPEPSCEAQVAADVDNASKATAEDVAKAKHFTEQSLADMPDDTPWVD